MFKLNSLLAATALTMMAGAGLADGHANAWTLDSDLSRVSFGSIKNNAIGESHSFGDVSGTVSADGAATIELGLASVETLIDIRNERMVEFVFQNQPKATITAQLDMAEVDSLAVGEATTVEAEGTLTLLGSETDLDANLFVMRLTDDQVMVTTNDMIMLSTEDTAIDGSIDKLQELASLDGITRVSPVALRLVFDAGK